MPDRSTDPRPSRRWSSVIILVVGAAATAWFLIGFHPAPAVPVDDTHRTAAPPDDCLTCHGPEGPVPQPDGHTNRQACFSCHRAG